jgi:adenosylcobinamide-GDP ribazoletransferase
MIAGLRLSVSLLSIAPVGSVCTDRATVGAAMALAPAVGLILGALAWAVGAAVHLLGGSGLLASVAAVATLAVITRGLHLDGLADLADGLGSAQPAPSALAVMRRSDIGPFGAATLVLVLLAQVAALAPGWPDGEAGALLITAAATGRLAVTWACRVGVPAARPDGLGALVAGSVPSSAAAGCTAAVLLAAVVAGSLLGGPGPALGLAGAALGGLAAALLLLRKAMARLGGVTGDVLGALIETGATGVLVVAALVLPP